MSLLDKFKDLNPNFTFDGAHMKRVSDLEAKHILMARDRMGLLNRLGGKKYFSEHSTEAEMFTQGYIDCGYDYETNILQTVFDIEELKFMEALMNWTTVVLPGEQSKKSLIVDKLKMLQQKLEKRS